MINDEMKIKFEESPKHVVAACTLMTNGSGQVLLIESPDRGWECPGGRIEECEDILVGLKREVLEETGTEVSVGQLTGVYSNLSYGVIVLSFLSTYLSGSLRTSSESLRVEWVERDECLKKISQQVISDRVKDMMSFNGKVLYQAYTSNPYQILEGHYI
ncbi:NUDIX hydrolase [Thermodesulfobacteriota bacterium]